MKSPARPTPVDHCSEAVVQAALQRGQSRADRFTAWTSRRWFLLFNIAFGLFVVLPFLAPVFKEIGWSATGNAIYSIYALLCHQLPQRSFFLFGPQTMYDLPTIQAASEMTIKPLILRQFIGNPEMGWKVAWSDRMVSMYSSILLVSWLWYPLRSRLKSLPMWGFFLFAAPMAVDGATHMLSDFAGIGQGFRDTNAWLAVLTNDIFSARFYAGDALGSFNSWLRFLTGASFGFGLVWFLFPILQETFQQTLRLVELKQRGTALRLEG